MYTKSNGYQLNISYLRVEILQYLKTLYDSLINVSFMTM